MRTWENTLAMDTHAECDDHIAAWRAAVDPDDVGLFEERLLRAGFTNHHLPTLLTVTAGGEPSCATEGDPGAVDDLATVDDLGPEAHQLPAWWATLTQLREACREAAARSSASAPEPESPRITDVSEESATSDDALAEPPLIEANLNETVRLDRMLADTVAYESADIAFSHLFAPMVAWAWQALCAQCPAAAALPASAARDARRALTSRLSAVSGAALGADFDDTRTAGATIMLRLGPDTATHGTSTRRYRQWCDTNLADGCTRLFDRFPVLGRLVATTCDQWRANMHDMLTRVATDREALAYHFDIPATYALTGIEWGLSDPHRGGRTVAVLSFADANTTPAHPDPPLQAPPGGAISNSHSNSRVTSSHAVRVVYKPKDVRIEQRYQNVLGLVESWLGDDTWRPQTILAMADEYGYAEYVHVQPCEDDAQLKVFYRNAGRLLAVLHLLGASDGHCENLIANGPMLHLIDAETLFEAPRVEPVTNSADAADSTDSTDASNPLAESVLRVGMLPTWSVGGEQQRAYDISALGVDSRDLTPTRSPGWRYPNTDDMVWAVIETTPSQPTSLPVPIGTPNPLAHHIADVAKGFTEVYCSAMAPEQQAELCAAIEAFRGVRRRIVLRATRVYAIVAEQATSATALSHANLRAFALEHLARSSLLSPAGHWTWEVCGAELVDMENLDIPYFDHPLGSQIIETSSGPISGVLSGAGDGLTSAVHRVQGMDEADLSWQSRLIRGSIRARYTRMFGRRAEADAAAPSAVDPAAVDPAAAASTRNPSMSAPGDLARAVDEAADAIHTGAVDNGSGDRTWLTLSLLPDGDRVQLSFTGDGLYDGRIGIAAFQAMAAGSTRFAATDYTDTLGPVARKALSTSPHVRHRYVRDLGVGWTGLGGLLRLWDTPAFRDIADTASAELTLGLIKRDAFFDLLGGVAGLIGPLSRRLRNGNPTDQTATVLRLAARHLADAQLTGGGWPFREATRPLTGLSHGASGMGIALIEAGLALRDEEFISRGVRAFAYERACFDDARGNWPDFRTHACGPDGQPSSMIAWCHGAPGIGLARLSALTLLPDHPDARVWREELEVAMATTSAAPLGYLDHLCCGSLGRAAVLRIAGLKTGKAEWLHAADELTHEVLARATSDGGYHFPFDDPDVTSGTSADPIAQSPGFMNGLAGVGAHFIATARNEHLGDVLI